jgi:hypothetical protein
VSVGGIAVGSGGSGVVVGGKTATAVGSTVGVELAQALTPRAVTAMTSSQATVLKIRAVMSAPSQTESMNGKREAGLRPPPDLNYPKKL